MASVTRVQEAAEAVCGALHRLGWEFLGDTNEGASSWFRRGDTRAKMTRIEVQRSRLADYLVVNIEWPVLANPPYPGRQTLNLNVGAAKHRDVVESTEKIVVRCLEIMRDVIAGTGVADPNNSKKAPVLEEES